MTRGGHWWVMTLWIVQAIALAVPSAAQVAQPPPSSPPTAYYPTPAPSSSALIPISDTSRLTSEQLFREIAQQDKNVTERFAGVNSQMAAIIKAADEFKANLQRFPTEVDLKIGAQTVLQNALLQTLQTRFEERFVAVAQQFRERDERVIQLANGTKVAVDLALNAQKDQVVAQNLNIAGAITEIKTTFGKLIDNQRDLQATSAKALEDKIGALKDQVTSIDSRSRGMGDSWVILVGAVTLIGGVTAIFVALSRRREEAAAPAWRPREVYLPSPGFNPPGYGYPPPASPAPPVAHPPA